MKRKPVNDRCCMNPDCSFHGQFGKGNIIRHSFYKTSSPGVEVRERDPDSRHAGRNRFEEAELPGCFHQPGASLFVLSCLGSDSA